jgi:glutamate-ammonia-ligase adenylyltransferase
MLVKARICAGDREAGASLLDRLQPFVYPSHAEVDPREEAHRHRRERRAREGIAHVTEHVKLAPGGIRDVEFIIQVLQLLYGGRRPEVRAAGALPGLERLSRYGVLPGQTATELESAYRFFRRLEHLIQMEEDRQTFLIPVADGRRRAIARLMGFEEFAIFLKAYDSHRHRVESALHSLLPGIGEEESGEPLETLLNLQPGGKEALDRLRRRGFARPEQSHRVLIAAGSTARAEGSNSWAAFVGLLPLLLQDAAATGAPDRAVNNLERLLSRLGSVGAYIRLLAKEPGLRRALLGLCASGELLTDLLTRNPGHFERLFSTRAASLAADSGGWKRRLREERRLSANSAELARRLESLRTRETLATGLAYAIGEITLEKAMSDLARLATDLLRTFLGEHLQAFLRPPAVGVLSLGTLSAGSMTFASDADLLFAHTAEASAEIQVLAARAAGLLSPPGGPYSVDMRLRPEGRSAPPSVDIDYLRHYVSERASPWEALAMARIRPLYGRWQVLAGAVDVIEEWLASFNLDGQVRAKLRKIRRTQEDELQGGSFFDVKRSPGGMADMEYLALGLALDGWERGKPRLTHIPSMLGVLRDEGRIAPNDAEYLTAFYQRLRGVQVGLQLHYGRDTSRLPADWGDALPSPALGSETVEALQRDAARVREMFDREFPI